MRIIRFKIIINTLFGNKLILLMLLITYTQSAIGDTVKGEFANIIMGIQQNETIKIIIFKDKTYIVSISNVVVTDNSPSSIVNAIKSAEIIAEGNLSAFVNGEDMMIREKVTTIKEVTMNWGGYKITSNKNVFDEFIRNSSTGALRKVDYLQWHVGDVYYHATIVKLE